MKINLFYVFVAGIMIAGIIFVWPKDSPASPLAITTPTPPPASVITSATSPLSAPTNLNGHAELPHTIFLSWDPVEDTTLARYRIVRNNLLIAEVTEPRFADASVTIDRAYGYYVQAIDGEGRFSQPSNFILVTVTSPVATVTPPNPKPTTTINNTSSSNRNTTSSKPKNSNTTQNSNTTISTNTNTSTAPQNYTVTVTEDGEFSPQAITIHPGDTITFTYVSGEGDEVVLSFTPSIGTSVKLDHERTNKTVTFNTVGTYSYRKTDDSNQTGTIRVTPL